MPIFRFLVLATAAVGGVLLTHARADAHALHAQVDTTNDPVKLEAFYDEDMPADFADVTVTDADGNVILTGKTNENGVWTFARPKPGKYTLTVRQGGHVATTEFGDEPSVFGVPRNKWIGLSIGVLFLVCVSGISWMRQRRARRLE